MLKWLQRDRRLALVVAIDLALAGLVGIIIMVQTLTATTTPSGPELAAKATVAPVQPTLATRPLPSLTFPALPTVNPTPLVALPNQGQSDAPPLPPGLQTLPTLTPGR